MRDLSFNPCQIKFVVFVGCQEYLLETSPGVSVLEGNWGPTGAGLGRVTLTGTDKHSLDGRVTGTQSGTHRTQETGPTVAGVPVSGPLPPVQHV